MTLDEAIKGLRGYCKPYEEGGAGHSTLTAEIKIVLAEIRRLQFSPNCHACPANDTCDLLGKARSCFSILETAKAVQQRKAVKAAKGGE